MNDAVAIIGAGVAGLAAGERLRRNGFNVTIFEKSRVVGGRMATRRRDGLSFDHGAQYLTAKLPNFLSEVRRWEAAGLADIWFDDKMVGIPGMSSVAQELARKHEILLGQRVRRLHHDQTGWSVESDGETETRTFKGQFGAVVLAIPSPQALDLVKTASIDLPELKRPVYSPCLAMMVAFEQPLPGVPDWLSPDDPVISWVARNCSKPGRASAPGTFIVHATPEWSRQFIQHDKEDIADLLLEAFYRLIGERQKPSALMGHRWRYALVEKALGKPFVWRPDVSLGACGDWCLGAQIECAFESGVEMADRLIDAGEL